MSAIQQMLLIGAIETDPYWAYVKALLHFESDLTDSAAAGPTYSFTSSGAITNASAIVGAGSLDCRTGSGSGVSSNSRVELALGASDFCVEMVFKDTGLSGANPWVFLLEGSITNLGLWNLGGNWTANGAGSGFTPAVFTPPTSGVVNHVAVTRNGNVGTVWVNGVSKQTWNLTGVNYGSGGATSWIGRSSGAGDYRLIIDEWRLTVGVPRYTAPFTPKYPFPSY